MGADGGVGVEDRDGHRGGRPGCAVVQGVHPRVVMETLGHSQISLTMNTYSHVLPALQREAADRMEGALATFGQGHPS